MLALLCLLFHPQQLWGQVDPPRPSVTAPSGTFIGSYLTTRGQRTISAFLGIPFAEPPVGKLRFAPPVPLSSLDCPYNAHKQPPACPMVGDHKCSEDCLYLNVYTPPQDTSCYSSSSLLPVYVWFYGGAFEIGSAYGYTHEYIMDEDVVFVVPQYRLGLFGFLSTGDEVVPGNMGLKDLRLALRWVQKNIASFGGDPTKVTIGGQSAGAVSVHYMMTFVHEGLFRAAITESGSSLVPWAFHPPDEVTRMVQKISELTGCPTDSARYVECLRDLSQNNITLLYTLTYKNTMYPGAEKFAAQMVPLIGGVIEPECVSDRLVLDNPWLYKTHVPYLVGVNSKEAITAIAEQLIDRTNIGFKKTDATFNTFFPQVINYQSSMADGCNIPRDVRSYYLNNQPISRDTYSSLVDASSDALFLYGVYEGAKRARQRQTYFYYFDYIGANELFPVPTDSRIGAAHTDELFFFFEHPNTRSFPRVNTTSDEILSRQLVKLWIQFVTHLDPTPCDLDHSGIDVKWFPFGKSESYLKIDETGFYVEEGFLPGRMKFWQDHPFPYRDEKFRPALTDISSPALVSRTCQSAAVFPNLTSQALCSSVSSVLQPLAPTACCITFGTVLTILK